MHTVKVSWVGQTFALAKCSDSGEKKSRVRRSKEERKAMVESFIKKYQSSNNGNFPSLNLTHKEVGGSFYTVREIVREIIQENRVLGPAKLISEEQGSDQFSKQYPLGSISTEPQLHFSTSSNEPLLVSIDHQIISRELVSTLREATDHKDKCAANRRYVNGNYMVEKHEEFNGKESLEQGNFKEQMDDVPIHIEVQVSEKLGGMKDALEPPSAKVAPMAAEMNGKYVNGNYMEEKHEEFNGRESSEQGKVRVPMDDEPVHIEVQVSEKLGVEDVLEPPTAKAAAIVEKVKNHLDASTAKITPIATDVIVETFPLRSVSKPTYSIDERSQETRNLTGDLEEQESKVEDAPGCASAMLQSMDSKEQCSTNSIGVDATTCFEDPMKEGLRSSVIVQSIDNGILKGTDLVNISGSNVLILPQPVQNQEIEPKLAPNQVCTQNVNSISTSSSSGEVLSQETVVIGGKAGIQHESWEGAPKRSAGVETNPIWAVLKAFIDAFVKFWSE
ncbi:PREDICTED: uncharacterized protein LOC104586176 [Nelumbo nucifera]|uniref:Uncharacterized protein LOC104586176 n=2 Tax=Nelumbo nucifera TaxID=4432 RepID=A0A1U7YUW1_NELNU|nr:PREDICTED: uncharacterized protein LOC104586176 [Nelumbo nucifera]XP_010241637.1 PREDICTED: uncharacterized protein LOC104586176 [Nelumbo nucifera]DAD28638.1 TPA_asm: hypothetical protein HUJ06_030106 [Nelumbo nucifera]